MIKSKKKLISLIASIIVLLICIVGVIIYISTKKDNDYSVSFIVDGKVYHSEAISSDKLVSFPENPTKYGYSFNGWYNGDNKITAIDPNFKGNISLVAKWEINLESTCFLFDTNEGYVITGLKEDSTLEPITAITIPDYVTAIGDYAFLTNSTLESVTFLENSQCETIGEYAFEYCDSITSITLPASIKSLSNAAFYVCSSLESVIFENNSSLETIGEAAFSDCESLKEIEIPKNVKTLGKTSFSGCTSLEQITFEKGSKLEVIDDYSFSFCTSIKKLKLPATVTTIGEGAFMNCNQLEEITFENNSVLESIGDHVLTYCTSLKLLEIPASVTQIGSSINYTLNELYYGNNITASNNVIGFNTLPLSSTTIYYYSSSTPETEGNYWHYVNGIITKW